MATLRALQAAAGVRLADSVAAFLGTIAVVNTPCGYAAPLGRWVADFGADADVRLGRRHFSYSIPVTSLDQQRWFTSTTDTPTQPW